MKKKQALALERSNVRLTEQLTVERERREAAEAAATAAKTAAAPTAPIVTTPDPKPPTLREQLSAITNPFERAAFVLENETALLSGAQAEAVASLVPGGV